MILHVEGDTPLMMEEAKKVLMILWKAYPNHPWSVRVYSGGIFIKHLQFSTNWGMNLKSRTVEHDARVMKTEIVRLAGEWLERCGMKRGAGEDQQPDYRCEGVPEADQPVSLRLEDPQDLIPEMDIVKAPERIEPRGQVRKLNGE